MTGISLDQLMPAIVAMGIAAGQSILRIALILVIGVLAVRLIDRALRRLIAMFEVAGRSVDVFPGAEQQRTDTLHGILRTTVVTAIWAIVAVLSLAQIGLDITPILAGAGILGLAVGFGAQNLVRDVISGFFLVLEDQVRVGDVAKVNGTGGQVEAVTFRTVVLRDEEGTVHVFPNGTITTLSNLTHGWSAYVINVGVAYKEDTDRVVEVMRQVGEQLRTDAAFGKRILEPIEIMGVDNFGDSAVVIKARFKTVPIEQWNVGREYRRRLKKAFDSHGIEMPFPHRTLSMGDASTPFKVQILAESPTLAHSGRT